VQGSCRTGFTCQPTVGDTCTYNNQCCSGNCVGENTSVYPASSGTCADNHAPIVADAGPFVEPFNASTTLTASVTDADAEDTRSYAWSLGSAPDGHGLGAWVSTAARPSVFLAVPGTYVFRVTVTDGPATQRNRLADQGSVTITAVNLAPVVNAGTDVAALLRNHSLVVSGTASDPNLTTFSCTWYATPPGGAEAPVTGASWAACPPSPQFTFSPSIDAVQGDWILRLEASDGSLVASDSRVVTVVNAAPVAQACPGCAAPPNARVGNLGAPGQPVPAIPLSGTATDQNSDVGTPGFTWEWTVSDVTAQDSAIPVGTVIASGNGTATPFTASFEPDAVGTYALTLRLDDGHGGFDDDTVVVRVDPYLRPLHPTDVTTGLPRGDVADAAYVHAADPANDRIVLFGRDDSSGSWRLWVLDPESAATAAVPYVALAAQPTCLGLSPDGSHALVGETNGWERASVSGAPSTSAAVGLTFTPADVLDAGTREFALSPSGQVYSISSSGGSVAPAQCTNCTPAGTRGVTTDGTLWLLDEGTDTLRRFVVRPNGDLEQVPANSVTGLVGSNDLWLSAIYGTSRDVVVGGGTTYAAGTLALGAGSLPFQARHLDSIAISNEIRGVVVSSTGTTVRKLGAGWTSSAADDLPVPRVGYLGTGYPSDARFAFVRSNGAARYVLVRAFVAGAHRWYLAKF
jgi:hypothetical protein